MIRLHDTGREADERHGEQAGALDRLARLQALTASLSEATTCEQVADAILAQASAVLGATAGVVYLLGDGGELVCLRTAGYPDEASAPWRRLPATARVPLADAVRLRQPVLLADRAQRDGCYPDIAHIPGVPADGALAALPLLAHGTAVGGIGLRFPQGQGFTEQDRAFLLTVAGLCAQALERARLFDNERGARQRAEAAERALRESEARFRRAETVLEGQKRILEMLVQGAPLPDVLEALCGLVEGLAEERLIATVLLLDEDGVHLRPAAGRRCPEAWSKVIDPLRIGPSVGSCGTAAYRGEPVVVADIATDPLWAGFADLALSFGLRACWSTPILSSRGRVLGTFAVYYDAPHRPDDRDRQLVDLVTRTAGIAIERSRADAALRDASRRKDEFLATLAHELRNPLAPLRNGLQILRLARDDPQSFDPAHGMMERQLAVMVRLIDDLLDVGRITRGKLRLRRERVELAAVVRSALEGSRPLIEAAGHELTLSLPDEPIALDADPTRLAQVLGNLLTNAAKYTDRGGRIRLSAQRRGGEVVVAVADNGIGIAAEYLPRLFEMFSQVQPALERSQGGLGIGLSLVKGLVEMHGGSVEARSEGPGKGSEFVVRLPVLDGPSSGEARPAEGRKGPAAGRHRRILVADDNRDAAGSLATILRYQGHEVQAVHDGEEAVEVAEWFRPDVALLDIGMPRLNGYECCRRIRRRPWGEGVVLVALTGWGQADDRRRALEAGFNHHVTKPVDPDELQEMLAR